MAIDAFDMAIVHRVFRDEFRHLPSLIREVSAGDMRRSAIVARHLEFMMAALHHHHAAEDELIWPKLHARAAARAGDISRMEDQHRGIADAVATIQNSVPVWIRSADPRLTHQLGARVEELSAIVDTHLADEECNIVPLINEYITLDEWRETTARGAEFLSRRNLKPGLVLGGYVLDAATADEGRRVLAGAPWAQRTMVRLFAKRTFAAYHARLYGPCP